MLPAPAASGTFPTLSLRILPCVPGPLSRLSRGVHLPVSSSTSSAFPRTLSRSASSVSPSKRFHDGSLFRDCSHFVMFRPSGLLASRSFLVGIELGRADCQVEGYQSRPFGVRGGFTVPPWSRFLRPPYNPGQPGFPGPVRNLGLSSMGLPSLVRLKRWFTCTSTSVVCP